MLKFRPYSTLVCLMAIYMFTTLTYTLWPVSSPNKILGFLVFFNVLCIFCMHITKKKIIILVISIGVMGWAFINTVNVFSYISDGIYFLISILLLVEIDSELSQNS